MEDNSPTYDDDDDDDDDKDVSLCDSTSDGGLLVVYQSQWQRRLLARYGCMCLLDATYKTTRYSLPLFLLCIRTNVDYVVAGVFITQSENSAVISEALELIRSWNTDWRPSWFMVDFSEAEINALESVFKGCKCHPPTSVEHSILYIIPEPLISNTKACRHRS